MVAVRADFYGRCAAYPELSRALGDNHVLVGPMTREELRRAIERPARRAGLVVEPELADALLADVEGEPGALPLLSTTLLELWGRRDGRRLQLAAYARSGGVQGAVARLAEDAYVALDPTQQAAARTLFLRLCDEDEGGTIVRRRIALDEQDARRRRAAHRAPAADGLRRHGRGRARGAPARVAAAARLAGRGLAGRRLHRRLREAARAWDAEGRDPGGLYRGARAGRGARLGGRARRRARADRARLPGGRPARERPRPAPPAGRARRRRRRCWCWR